MSMIDAWQRFKALGAAEAREFGRRVEMLLALLLASAGVGLLCYGLAGIFGGSARDSVCFGLGAALAVFGFAIFQTSRDRK